MNGKSHFAHGCVAGAAYACVVPAPPAFALLAGAAVSAFALAPDLDHVNARAVVGKRAAHDAKYVSMLVRSFGGHRTWTHEPQIGPPIFAAVLALILAFAPGEIGRLWWAFAGAMLVGCLTHLYGDARTISGIPCRYVSGGRITIGRTIRTGSDAELNRYRRIYQPLSILAPIAPLWLLLVTR